MSDCTLDSSFSIFAPWKLHVNFCFNMIKRNLEQHNRRRMRKKRLKDFVKFWIGLWYLYMYIYMYILMYSCLYIIYIWYIYWYMLYKYLCIINKKISSGKFRPYSNFYRKLLHPTEWSTPLNYLMSLISLIFHAAGFHIFQLVLISICIKKRNQCERK